MARAALAFKRWLQMKVHNLGEFDTPVLVFGGPYSNLHATRALRAEADTLGIAPNACICTGYVVAYFGDAAAIVAEIRDRGCPVAVGNWEQQQGAFAEDCGCGFEEGSVCDNLSAVWFAFGSRTIGPKALAWMRDCPDLVTFVQVGKRFAVIYGGVRDISLFLWQASPKADFTQELEAITRAIGPVDAVISGHCDISFQRFIGDVAWFNPGVIGMPPHYGAPETRFCVLEHGAMTVHRLRYDAGAAQAAMIKTGLVQGYHTALMSGYWPSEDVPPSELRLSSD